MEPVVPSIFEEMEQYKPLPYASKWQRFINCLIDSLVIYLLGIMTIIFLAFLTEIFQVDLVGVFFSEEPSDRLLATLYSTLIGLVLSAVPEAAMKGRSIGKLITGTRAVRKDNTQLKWKDAILRSLVRFIPFEPLSAFSSNGLWHDRLSKTVVVKTRGK